MSPRLRRAAYAAWLALRYGRRGLPTSINGEPMRLVPAARSVAKWNADRTTRVYEPGIWELLLGELRPGDVVVDVGANVGLYAVAAARRVPDGRVWAVEPDPRNAGLLRRHLALNGVADRVAVVEAAAGAARGSIGFSAQGIPQSSVEDLWGSGGSLLQVPLVRLDETIERIDVLKVDVEGYEGQALEGAAGLLADAARRPRAILVEVHADLVPAAGWTVERLRQLLVDAGYVVEDVPAEHAQRHWLARLPG